MKFRRILIHCDTKLIRYHFEQELQDDIKNDIITMTKREKRWRKLLRAKGCVSFKELETILNNSGSRLLNIRGSHRKFESKDGKRFTIPVHNHMVKRSYIKMISKIINKIDE